MQTVRRNAARVGPAQGETSDPFQVAMDSRDRDVPQMVRAALAENRAQLAFQPVITAEKAGHIAFYEGLIRLRDQEGRILPANLFMSQVEDRTLGRDLDCASIRLGLAMLHNNPHLRLSINMSARSIGDSEWRRTLEAGLLRGTGIGDRLILEISEGSAMLLPEVVIRFMAEMQPRGISFALDDFGAGLISFRYLKDFFFDMVKIDSYFTRNIDTSSHNQVLAEALITVARQFDMFTVSEGVETKAEAAVLRRLGVDCLQGYLFGVPKQTL